MQSVLLSSGTLTFLLRVAPASDVAVGQGGHIRRALWQAGWLDVVIALDWIV